MTHDLPDYYTVLGVASTASSAEIAHACRRRVRSQHPDARPDTGQDADSEGLGEVIAAYAVRSHLHHHHHHVKPPQSRMIF
jgi:DnaJ-class molecular chaperone